MTATSPTGIFTDAPISQEDDDRLERKTFAAHVADRITAAGGYDSVAFGLTGSWGSGKTSVLRMIAGNMPTPEWSVHYFTPWAASDSAALVKEFYATIESALPKDVAKKVGGKLRAMVPLAAGAASMIPVAGKAVGTVVEEAGRYFEKSFQKQFEEASKEIVGTGTRILVVVDDIDRLHADELVAVLKTVRLLGNFPGIHYLLAYDQDTVCDVLTTTSIAKNTDRALQFLEKIVQYPFDLPPLQNAHRATELTTALARVEAAHQLGPTLTGRSQFGSSAVETLLTLVPPGDLGTLRAIHRLVTQFDIALTVIRPDEIDPEDLLVLTYMRVRYPKLYQKLPAWRSKLLWKMTSPRNGQEAEWNELVAGCFDEAPESARVEHLKRVLHYLFPAIEGDWMGGRQSRPCRISEAMYFDRYFVMGIPVGDISDADVQAGLAELARTGTLDEHSALRAALVDEHAAANAAEKCCRFLTDAMSGTTAANALSGAKQISGLLEGFGTVSGLSSAARFAGGLAWIALDRSVTAGDARAVLEELVNEWGLTVTVREIPREVFTSPESLSETLRAVEADLRRRCLEACIADVDAEDSPETGSVLFHLDYLNAEGLDDLRRHVRGMVDSGREIDELAARFVSVYTVMGSSSRTVGTQELGPLNLGDFEAVLSREYWRPRITARPEDSDEIDENDVSFHNRVRRARQAMMHVESSDT
ncbi:KAP family P-loop NTPase fold protein [Rhodococcus opacus]|nr:P-loop NTPase fold protein [Rhodococcus opacus]